MGLSASSRALGPWFQRVLSTIFKKIERRSLQRWEHQFVPSLYTSLPFGVCAHIFRKRLFDDLGDAHSRPLKISSRAAFSCMDHPLGHERERERAAFIIGGNVLFLKGFCSWEENECFWIDKTESRRACKKRKREKKKKKKKKKKKNGEKKKKKKKKKK